MARSSGIEQPRTRLRHRETCRVCLAMVVALAAVGLVPPRGHAGQGKDARGPYVIDEVPRGFHLYAYDDCGVVGHQSHVRMEDSYLWTFNTSDTDADLKSRSAVFSYKSVRLAYTGLSPKCSYVLALTYASDHVYRRVQSLWADGVELHSPLELPKAVATRVVVQVPAAVTRDGSLNLELKIHGEVNATVSVVELWSDAPPPNPALRIEDISGLVGDLTGKVLDLACEPAAGAAVSLVAAGGTSPLADVTTGSDGSFTIPRARYSDLNAGVRLVARHGQATAIADIAASDLDFRPVRYRPLPAEVGGLDRFTVSLDGAWLILPRLSPNAHEIPLSDAGWKPIRMPGQWRQQGFDLPRNRPVAMARVFDVPADWAGRRVVLHFDSIHAGTRYRVNGTLVGTSENLFTPVQWDITSLVRPGQSNRLDLEMTVDTTSERLSYSSDYAFHSLGGIDRSVRLVALPDVNLRSLVVRPALDRSYRDGRLDVTVGLENTRAQAVSDARLRLVLTGPGDNQAVVVRAESVPERLGPGESTRQLGLAVSAPRHWTAETPVLYRAAVELEVGGQVVERVVREVGFRSVEIQGSRLLLNGVPIKLAGACHHEVDPLTGRAATAMHAREDVALLKGANLNFLRTSHYPPTIELVEAADRLGMYLEVEAPFCWVGPGDDAKVLREVLIPTSAMVDYYQSHPSVIHWSLANESNFNRCFEESNRLVKQLDPTRPTTFNNPDPKRVCDIANIHYPAAPLVAQGADDPRPVEFGEYNFPVCHELTEGVVNPGLREFFGAGHSDPSTPWAQACAEDFGKPMIKPCMPPGSWVQMLGSPRVTGGAIWAGVDDAFYFPDGTHVGYAWHHGFWGVIDGWRRPKPEWWLAKLVFSPVQFPQRTIERPGDRDAIAIPVENRYAFTNLGSLRFDWRIGNCSGSSRIEAPPGRGATLTVPTAKDDSRGAPVEVRVLDPSGTLVTAAQIRVGSRTPRVAPTTWLGPLDLEHDGSRAVLKARDFTIVLDTTSGDIAADLRHTVPLRRFPRPHLTLYDFGEFAGPTTKPYAVLPADATRRVDRVEVSSKDNATEIVVHDRYNVLEGSTSLTLDRTGHGVIRYDYVYRGEPIDTREAGVRLDLPASFQTLKWRRWTEWGIYPDDWISRPAGTAHAFRAGTHGPDPEGVRPSWPWSQDQTELGTAEFRSVKFHVYEASLTGADGAGVRVDANADRHVRACITSEGVRLHVLTRCPMGQVGMRAGDRVQGQCTVQWLASDRASQ